jgi:hypothetical protein
MFCNTYIMLCGFLITKKGLISFIVFSLSSKLETDQAS